MDIMSVFSERLKELMFHKNNIKSNALATEIGVSGQAVRKWTSGKSLLYLQQLLKLVEFFDCSIEFIVGKTDVVLDFSPRKCPAFYDRLREVMAVKNISYYRFVNETRFKENFIDQWKKGADPHLLTLIELSKYFEVTLDYLVGRES